MGDYDFYDEEDAAWGPAYQYSRGPSIAELEKLEKLADSLNQALKYKEANRLALIRRIEELGATEILHDVKAEILSKLRQL
ncbi:hypothetical protein QEH42_gp171 [Microbacterium phage Pumpernickel]|uniref:Uncharacterized protein n=1 Tax=Microbacterium phage Pumpernickel TaxID=2885983 RepID=A0AAE8YA53_9CAUD|nr:hypothetical protein QEH42_gp171 [Microbacterium phage Pumpernickel]UDL16047.1 hypothetical protein SEA_PUMPERNICKEL_297 [Microbacterium phage Pumpernickel]